MTTHLRRSLLFILAATGLGLATVGSAQAAGRYAPPDLAYCNTTCNTFGNMTTCTTICSDGSHQTCTTSCYGSQCSTNCY